MQHSDNNTKSSEITIPDYEPLSNIKLDKAKGVNEPHITSKQLEILKEHIPQIGTLKMQFNKNHDAYTMVQEEWNKLHKMMTEVMPALQKKAELMIIMLEENLIGQMTALDAVEKLIQN